jgi:hypothetical protein
LAVYRGPSSKAFAARWRLSNIQDLLGGSDYKTAKGYPHTVDGTLAKAGNRISKHRAENEDEEPGNKTG